MKVLTMTLGLVLTTSTLAQAHPKRSQPTNQGAKIESYGQVLPHPEGCPARAFCGCGVSVKVFGYPVKNLFLAANWLKFPRANPGPGMVAARRGHVMYIESVDGYGNATVYDPNGGLHKTWRRVRSLAGYRVVDPRSTFAQR